jgi:N-acylneuraminate cytidylyltransferase
MRPETRIIAFIFARGGSKGIPRKNLQDLGGRPLIAHSIQRALAIPSIERVVVSTDDAEIAEVSRSFGAEVPFERPAELAGDTAPEYLAWKHAIAEMTAKTGPFDIMVSLPATSPLRSVDDVSRCIRELIQNPDADAVITVQQASRNPYFNMVVIDGLGYCSVVNGASGCARRQDAPKVYDVTTVAYASRTRFVESSSSLFDGRIRCVEVPRERAVDIDDPMDLEIARMLFQRNAHPKK